VLGNLNFFIFLSLQKSLWVNPCSLPFSWEVELFPHEKNINACPLFLVIFLVSHLSLFLSYKIKNLKLDSYLESNPATRFLYFEGSAVLEQVKERCSGIRILRHLPDLSSNGSFI